MCGFFASNDPVLGKEHEDTIHRGLAFRGPDYQSGVIQHNGWTLYHSRLSIIAPIETYAQPFISESGGCLIFNGEILNFKDLAAKYGLRKSVSDTEVLSQLLEIESFDLNEIEGFFALVFIDKQGVLTHCARDRFGVKPLVYHKNGQFLSISSEASVLREIYNLDYSDEALEEYRVFRAPIFTGSYFQSIETVTPGTCLIGGTYFDTLDYVCEANLSLAEAVRQLRVAIPEAINTRLVSDVPVGLLFSGGIDSNIIDQFSDISMQRYTGGMKEDYDVAHAKSVSEPKNPVNVVSFSNEEFSSHLEKMIAVRGEPLSVPNEVVLSLIAQSWADSGGKVLLSGEAADEFFGGYDRIYQWAANAGKFDIDEFLSRYGYYSLDKISNRIRRHVEAFFLPLEHLSVFEQIRQFFLKVHLPVLFRRLDFALMFSGVEGREPLAAFKLFEISMKIDPQFLFARGLGKAPLREVIAASLGEDFAFRKKVGFPIDLGLVFHGKKSATTLDNYEIWQQKNMELLEWL